MIFVDSPPLEEVGFELKADDLTFNYCNVRIVPESVEIGYLVRQVNSLTINQCSFDFGVPIIVNNAELTMINIGERTFIIKYTEPYDYLLLEGEAAHYSADAYDLPIRQ